MVTLYLLTGLCLLVSLLKSRIKTIEAVKIGTKKFLAVLPVFTLMITLISLVQLFFSSDTIASSLGKNSGISGVITSLALGSITLMPGFIVFPLGGILIDKGASYMVVALFTNATMLVGCLSFPLEKKYLGVKISLIRNIFALFISVITGVAIGYFYGEL